MRVASQRNHLFILQRPFDCRLHMISLLFSLFHFILFCCSEYFSSQWPLGQRVVSASHRPPSLAPYNTLRLVLQVSIFCFTFRYGQIKFYIVTL